MQRGTDRLHVAAAGEKMKVVWKDLQNPRQNVEVCRIRNLLKISEGGGNCFCIPQAHQMPHVRRTCTHTFHDIRKGWDPLARLGRMMTGCDSLLRKMNEAIEEIGIHLNAVRHVDLDGPGTERRNTGRDLFIKSRVIENSLGAPGTNRRSHA